MSLKTSIINLLLRIAGLILRKVEREEYEKQQALNVSQKVIVNSDNSAPQKPYRYMSDEVKRFIMQDLTPNDKVKVSCDIALFEGAKVSPYTLTAPEAERFYIITDGQITGSGTYK